MTPSTERGSVGPSREALNALKVAIILRQQFLPKAQNCQLRFIVWIMKNIDPTDDEMFAIYYTTATFTESQEHVKMATLPLVHAVECNALIQSVARMSIYVNNT